MNGLGIGFIFLFLFNFAISWLNAWGVGRTWQESKAAGGFEHLVTWCAAIMSGCGFTWCYMFVLAFLAGTVPYHGHPILAAKYVDAMLKLGYVVIILPILGSGLGITISSWRDFKRNKNLLNGGVAAYNTYAQIHNTINAIQVMPEFLSDIASIFKDDDDKNSTGLIVLLVGLALVGGFMTTFAIIKSTARKHFAEVQWQLATAKEQQYNEARQRFRY